MSKDLQKIDIHETNKQLEQSIRKLKEDESITIKNRELIKKFLDDSAVGLTATFNARVKEVGTRARLKNLYLLKTPAKYFKKNFDKVNVEDMKSFIADLKNNTITKEDGSPYSEQTKSNVKKTFKIFLRWLHKESPAYFELTKWIDYRFKKKSPDSLSEEEVVRMIDYCSTLKQKTLVVLLFSTGARIEEFLNIRFRDVRKVQGDIPYYTITFRDEYSKTVGRDVDLTWKDSNEVLKQWLEFNNDKKPTEPIYDSTYDGVRQLLKKISERAIGKIVTPHLIRHSAATLDASSMTSQQLCIKYGWSFSSNMPDTYIKRAGVNRKQIVEKFKSEKLDEIQTNNRILEESLRKIKSSSKNEIDVLKKRLDGYEALQKSVDKLFVKLEKQGIKV